MNIARLGSEVYLITSKGTLRGSGLELYNKLAALISNGASEEEVIAEIEYKVDSSISKTIDILTKLGITHQDGAFYWDSPVTLPEFMVNYLSSHTFTTEDLFALKNFWQWSQLNPNPASRDMLMEHCMVYGIKITSAGMLVLYRNMVPKSSVDTGLGAACLAAKDKAQEKGRELSEYCIIKVNDVYVPKRKSKAAREGFLVFVSDIEAYIKNPRIDASKGFTDSYSKTMHYELGVEASIPRESCDESAATCSKGLHLASNKWLSQSYFGNVGVACLVNPMHIVSAPKADTYGKVRTCAFLPVALVEYKDGKIVESDYNFESTNYAVDSLKQLQILVAEADLVDGAPNRGYSIPELISRFKVITDFQDIDLQSIKTFYEDKEDLEDSDYDEEDDDEYDVCD
jgi:hypothetical protein